MGILEFFKPPSQEQIRQEKIEELRRAFRRGLDSGRNEYEEKIGRWLVGGAGVISVLALLYFLSKDPEFLTDNSVVKPQPEMVAEAAQEELEELEESFRRGEFTTTNPAAEERRRLLDEAIDDAITSREGIPDSHFNS